MQTRGAIIRQAPGKYEVVDLEVDDPRAGEVQVKMVASGLCHSDDHSPPATSRSGSTRSPAATRAPASSPRPGRTPRGSRRATTSSSPSCPAAATAAGARRACRTSATSAPSCSPARAGTDPTDFRMSLDGGSPVGQMCGISTFCETTTVSADSAVKVPDDVPLDDGLPRRLRRRHRLGLGGQRGRRSQPGHTVIVMGIGGIGINAVQGAAHAGASNVIAVDPVAFKREKAQELGATHAVRVHGGGHRARQAVHQRPGRRLGDRHRRRDQARARRPGARRRSARPAPSSSPALGNIAERRRCRSRWPSSRCSRSGSRARCSARPTRTGTSCASWSSTRPAS